MGLVLAVNNSNEIDKKEVKKSSKKVKKDGNVYSISNTNTGKQKGDKAHPLKTLEEITSVIEYYENKAEDPNTKAGYRQLADRNKLLLTLGFNVGIRASDLVKIKWNNVYDSNGRFIEPDEEDVDTRESSRIEEKKTHKIKNLIFNDLVRETFEEYVKKYKIDKCSDNYVFESRQADENGEYCLTVTQCSNIVKEAVKACGIKRRVASHTLRKTFAYHQMYAHQDDSLFASSLMELLNHESYAATEHYTCKDTDRLVKYHNDVQLGKVSKVRNQEKVHINNENQKLVDSADLIHLLKQLSEKCYTCNNDCNTCYNAILAKKYGYDLNTI
jgi:integrase